MKVERTDFIAVPVSDLGQADEFYGQTLALARNPHASGERWVEYETGNLTLALSMFGGGVALGVDDVHEARRTLEQAGVEFPHEVFDSGVCHVTGFKDTDGNSLMLHRRYAPLEPYDKPATDVQRTDFVGVNVTDRAQVAEFYGGLLGLAEIEKPEVLKKNGGLWYGVADVQLHVGVEDVVAPSKRHPAFEVEDLEAVRSYLEENGVRTRDERDVPGARRFSFFDPFGNRFELMEKTAGR